MIINTDRLFRLYGEIFPIPSITVNVVPLLNPCHEYHHSKHLSAPLICYTSIIPPRSFNHIESSTDTFLFKTNIVRETSGTFLKSLSHIVKAVGTSSVSTGCNKGPPYLSPHVRETSGTFLKSLSHIVKAVGTSSVSTGATKVLHIFHLRKSSIVPCWANPLLSH